MSRTEMAPMNVSLMSLETMLIEKFKAPAKNSVGVYVDFIPAKSMEQIREYLSGNAASRAKVAFYDGSRFHPLG